MLRVLRCFLGRGRGMTDTNQKAKRDKPHAPPKESIELREDGWDRFEGAVDAAIKSGPKHRLPKDAEKSQ